MSDSFIPVQNVTPDFKLDTEQLTVGANVVQRERVQVPDGQDINAGATTDAAVTGDNAGTSSGKLRGLNKLFADVWDNINHWLQVKVMNTVAVTGTFFQGTQPVSEADGADVNAGATTDAFVQGDAAGTLSAKLRGINKILFGWSDGDRAKVNIIQSIPLTIGSTGAQHTNDNINNFNVTGPGGQATFDATNNGGGSCVVAITGTWVGTLSFLGTLAEGTTTPVPAVALVDGSVVYSTTGNGKFTVILAGLNQIIVRLTAWTSGTAVVYVNQAQIGHGVVVLANPLPTGANVIGQVTANAGANLNTSLLALDSTVAKDFSLATIDTDIKATQPRDITDRSARLLGHVTVDSDVTSLPVGQALMNASSPVVIASDQLGIYDREDRKAQEIQIVSQYNLTSASYAMRGRDRVRLMDYRGRLERGNTR